MVKVSFDGIVKKIVKTETRDGVSRRVILQSGEGHYVSLKLASEEEAYGYAIGMSVHVSVENPQQPLRIEGAE